MVGAAPSPFDAHHVLAVGHEEEHERLRGAHERPIANVVAAPLHLYDLPALQLAKCRLSTRGVHEHGVDGEDVFEVIFLFHLVLREKKVVVDELDIDKLRRVSKPSQLLLCGLDGTFEMQISLDGAHAAVGVLVDTPHNGVAPAHERHLLALAQRRGVVSLQLHGAREKTYLFTERLVLGMSENGLCVWLRRPAAKRKRHESLG
mmetsp:Transcript_8710/g.19037  ORF Transcript_8710/g.19037 Transcript_8710/m.19037 type:complete len:204 (+) Transcript_8710:285-896(+)